MIRDFNIDRIMIAATRSGGGKTTVTCGLLKALRNRGKAVASFKCGPDYIDPMFHSEVLEVPSRNLDLFFSDENVIKYLLMKNTRDMDMAVMEGVMGYYDGIGGTTVDAGAYDLAKTTDTPTILVVDCKGKSVSVVAEIKGFVEFKEDSNIKGVILNRVSSMLYPKLKEIIESQVGVKCYGYLPYMKDCALESRHLGLITAQEIDNIEQIIGGIAAQVEESVDLDGILELAASAPMLSCDRELINIEKQEGNPKIAVAYDEAFCFYYRDNLELLEDLGAEVVSFSPVNGEALPEDTCGVIFGGGYPELYLRDLEYNNTLKSQLCTAIEEGMPVFAECGGFMYLQDYIQDEEGEKFQMVGAIPGGSIPTGKLNRFGYINVETKVDSILGPAGTKAKAHEFHYWDAENPGSDCVASKPIGNRSWDCVVTKNNLFAGYPHIHYYSNLDIPKNFVSKCIEYKNKNK